MEKIKRLVSELILITGLNTASDYDGIETLEDIELYLQSLINHYKGFEDLKKQQNNLNAEISQRTLLNILRDNLVNGDLNNLLDNSRATQFYKEPFKFKTPKGAEISGSLSCTVYSLRDLGHTYMIELWILEDRFYFYCGKSFYLTANILRDMLVRSNLQEIKYMLLGDRYE